MVQDMGLKAPKALSLPTDAAARKAVPVVTGVIDYFPDAIAAVAELSRIGNDQHNPGQPLHWSKHKSTDHSDCLGRHLIDRGTLDADGVRHSTKVAWRALAMLQIEIEADRAGSTVEAYLANLRALAALAETAKPAQSSDPLIAPAAFLYPAYHPHPK